MRRNGGASSSEITGTKSKANRDVKFASHKQTLQHTVRAKKINESHLFNLLRSVDDQKSRRSFQIDKEVGEVEKFLQKLTKDQDEIKRLKTIRHNTRSALSNSLPNTSNGSSSLSAKHYRRQTINSNLNENSKFKQKAFRMKMMNQTKTPDAATELITSYYKFDSNGNRINNVQMNSLSSPLVGFKESKVAWEYIPDNWSMSGLSLKDFGNFSATSSKHSETSSARSRQTSSDVADQDSEACSSGLDVPIAVFEETHRTHSHALLPSDSNRLQKANDVIGMRGRVESNSPFNISSPSTEAREIESGRKSNIRRGDSSGLRREVTFSETPEVTHIRSHVRRKTFPQLNRPSGATAKKSRPGCDGNNLSSDACEYSDCIYHNRTYLLSAQNKECTAEDYYKTLSRVGEVTGKMARILGKDTGTPPSDWKATRRSAVTPSPTPSDIFRDIDTSVGNGAKQDYTDLDVMSSVRRPTKGSNREMMLRTKEVNLITTFAMMRKRVADRIPQDFNRNYGTPTPNWKILNPLKLRHKITHSSPLFVKWKF